MTVKGADERAKGEASDDARSSSMKGRSENPPELAQTRPARLCLALTRAALRARSMPTENEWREVLDFLFQLSDGDIRPDDASHEAEELLLVWGER